MTRYRVRFVNPVWPGDSLNTQAIVREVRDGMQGRYVDFEILTTNQHDVAVLSGSATARI